VQALIDGPANVTGVRRQVINFKSVSLTDFTVNIARNARQAKLTKEWAAADVAKKFASSGWGKKLASKAVKAKATDFDRFRTTVAHRKVMAKIAPKKA
jgi:large subunit ribosomal protein L14e